MSVILPTCRSRWILRLSAKGIHVNLGYGVTRQQRVTEHTATTPSQLPSIAFNAVKAVISCNNEPSITEIILEKYHEFRRTEIHHSRTYPPGSPKFYLLSSPYINGTPHPSTLHAPNWVKIFSICQFCSSESSESLLSPDRVREAIIVCSK